VRTFFCGFLAAALCAAPAAAQAPAAGGQKTTTTTSGPVVTSDEVVLEGDTTPRRALPTFWGDTGFWFVPTAETLPSGKWSFSAFRANYDRRQGLTDVNQIGITGAIGLFDKLELFGSWRIVRLDRDVIPTFVPEEPVFGGVSQEYPYMRRGWSKTLGGPFMAGAKWSLISQGQGDAMSLAPRVMVKFPSGATWASTNDWDGHFDLVASREFEESFELSGTAGGVIRGDSDEFRVSDGVTWGLGTRFPTRSAFSALIEWQGEFVIKDNTLVLNPPYTAEDGSIAPLLSPISDPTNVKFGGVWQNTSGLFVHAGANYSFGTDGRVVAGQDINHNAWGFDLRVGFHPGVTPQRERVRRIRETTTITNTVTLAPPPAVPNRSPTVTAQCNPCVVEPGQTSQLTAQATDPEGGPLTYAWTVQGGTVNPPNAATTTWTAPNQEGSVQATVTVTDNANNQATASTSLLVRRTVVLEFEDIHFDFDRFNLRPDALKLLDEAVARLQANPSINVTVEGHCDSIGTQQYNLALGERRASSARDYLISRGIAASRLRTVSFGEDRPIDTNETPAGRARNRRAHLAIIMQ
jgi:outer membrane protein OmpA-like peptidoglycan-associated protein